MLVQMRVKGATVDVGRTKNRRGGVRVAQAARPERLHTSLTASSTPGRTRTTSTAPVRLLFEVAAVLSEATEVSVAGAAVLEAAAIGFGWQSGTLWVVDQQH